MSEIEQQVEPTSPPDAGEKPMALEHVTADDFAAGCEEPIGKSRKVCVECHGSLYQKAQKEAETGGDERAARVYLLLAAVTQIHFKPNDKAEPYGPMFVMERRRSLIPGDLRGAQSEVFSAVAPNIVNPGLRARLADIAWLNDRKQAAMAR